MYMYMYAWQTDRKIRELALNRPVAPCIFLIFTCYRGGLNLNNSSNLQIWSVKLAAIAGVLSNFKKV